LNAGGPVGAESGGEVAVAEVAKTLGHCENGAFISPDPMARPGDASLDHVPVEYFTIDDGIYYIERRPLRAASSPCGSRAPRRRDRSGS
jgi:hypothetical protein